MHECEIFDVCQFSGIRPKANIQSGNLFRERVAPCRCIADAVM
jgi:hypothetical protein